MFPDDIIIPGESMKPSKNRQTFTITEDSIRIDESTLSPSKNSEEKRAGGSNLRLVKPQNVSINFNTYYM